MPQRANASASHARLQRSSFVTSQLKESQQLLTHCTYILLLTWHCEYLKGRLPSLGSCRALNVFAGSLSAQHRDLLPSFVLVPR